MLLRKKKSCTSSKWWHPLFYMRTYLVETKLSWKSVQTTTKKSSKFTNKITYVDDMMIHNLVKYFVQTWLRLWDIKITNLKPRNCPNDLLEICYFYISQMKSSLDMIFYKVVYHHIIYMCDFFREFRWLFFVVYTSFHEHCSFHRIRSQLAKAPNLRAPMF